jgi:hypothetical protein
MNHLGVQHFGICQDADSLSEIRLFVKFFSLF